MGGDESGSGTKERLERKRKTGKGAWQHVMQKSIFTHNAASVHTAGRMGGWMDCEACRQRHALAGGQPAQPLLRQQMAAWAACSSKLEA
jgi:hypothetical protein